MFSRMIRNSHQTTEQTILKLLDQYSRRARSDRKHAGATCHTQGSMQYIVILRATPPHAWHEHDLEPLPCPPAQVRCETVRIAPAANRSSTFVNSHPRSPCAYAFAQSRFFHICQPEALRPEAVCSAPAAAVFGLQTRCTHARAQPQADASVRHHLRLSH